MDRKVDCIMDESRTGWMDQCMDGASTCLFEHKYYKVWTLKQICMAGGTHIDSSNTLLVFWMSWWGYGKFAEQRYC